jgi:hypothetical protein
MKTSLAVAFLSGQYDPENKQESKKAKIVQARLSKPKTTVVKVVSDWAYEPPDRPVKPKQPKPRAKRIYQIDGIPSVMLTAGGKYQVQIKHWARNFYLGVFDTIEEAVTARDTAKAELIAGTFVYRGKIAVDERVRKKKASELPKFIYWSKDKGKYLIQRTLGGKKLAHGTYKTLEEAVERLKELGWV